MDNSISPGPVSPNDRLGSPGFLLRPPDMAMLNTARSLSVRAESTAPSPSQAGSFRPSRVRVRPQLDQDVTGTPTKHGQQSSGPWRPIWTASVAGQAPPNPLPPRSCRSQCNNQESHEQGPSAPRVQEPRWTTNGNSTGCGSSGGGWGSSPGGGPQSEASPRGMSAVFPGSLRCDDLYVPVQKTTSCTPQRASQRPSPVPEHGRTGECSSASTPNTGQLPDYSYPSSRGRKSQMPDYMKVFTVPKDVHDEVWSPAPFSRNDVTRRNRIPDTDDVIIEPIIQNLGISDKEMERRISEQMGNLYLFFRRLYDQDQEEIRCLQAQMEQRDMEIRRLRRTKLGANESEMATSLPIIKWKPKKDQHQFLVPTATWRSDACSSEPPLSPLKQPADMPVISMMMPPVISPARPFFKWWANVHSLYTRHSTLWQGLLFLLLLILSVGLLAGLLTRRPLNNSTTNFADYTQPGPTVIDLSSRGLAFTVNMSQGTSTFFALVPTVKLFASNRTPSATDVRTLLQGPTLSPLHGLAVACGERIAMQSQVFTFNIAATTIAVDNLGPFCEITGALPDRCSLCPNVQPGTSYALLVTFSDSDDLHQTQVTTAPLPLPSSLPLVPPTPSSPIPLEPSLPSSQLPTPGLSPSAPPPPMPPPQQPSPSPAAPLAPLAPTLQFAPTASAVGQTSFEFTFSLSRPGLVRFIVMFPVLYAQSGGAYVSFATSDPIAGQPFEVMPAPSQTVLGQNGVAAAGTVNVTTDLPYTVRVDGTLPGVVNAAATCSCGAGGCNCTVPAPCQGKMCNIGPSALAPNTTYKVFMSISTPDGVADTQKPIYVGSVTTGADLVGPLVSSSAAIAQKTITPSGFTLSGIHLDTEALLYIMVSKPANGQQSIPAGTATTLKEDVIVRRRHLAVLRGRPRTVLQQAVPAYDNTDAGDSLLVADSAPIAQMFAPACPRKITCDTAKVSALYLDQAVEVLALPIRCIAVASIHDGPMVQVLDGLANDTAYIVRVVAEDVASNQRVYRALVRTVDRRPPEFSAVAIQTSFFSFNLSVTLSEPGALVGYLYTATGSANISLTASSAWPPSPQGPVIQQVQASTAIQANGTMPSGATTYVMSFTHSSISPKTTYSVALIARDLAGNVQTAIRLVTVRTDDNIPPVWLETTLDRGAYNATLSVQIDEPSTAWWFCLFGDVLCPQAATLFGFDNMTSLAIEGLVSWGNVTIITNNGNGSVTIGGLRDGLQYTLCLVAQDASVLRNRQTSAHRLAFSTLDQTPPILSFLTHVSGADVNFTCDRSTFRCQLSLNVSLNEAGTSILALQYADAHLNNFTAATLVGVNVTNPPSGILRAIPIQFNSSGSTEVHLSDLVSGESYILDAAAVDISGNIQPLLQSRTFIAPDVIPPSFILVSATSIADTFITVNVSLNEPSTILWLIARAGLQAPNRTQLFAAVQRNETMTGSTPYVPRVAGAAIMWNISSLAVGKEYDLHLLAQDANGNQQANVTSISRVRVIDSIPPVIHSLTIYLTPTGNRLIISVNASKPGTLHYIALPLGASVPTRQQLLEPVTAATANFSGQMPVTTALSIASAVLCVADGRSYEIWAMQEDTEGQHPNRQPNYSNITRGVQLSQSGADTSTCAYESRMRPLVLESALTQGSFGWPVGRITPAASTPSNASALSWVQDYYMIGGLGGGVNGNGTVVAFVEGQQLGKLEFQPTWPPPTQIRVVVQTPVLYLEPVAAVITSLADAGRVLRFAFQLQDSASRPTSFTGLRIVPSLSTSSYTALVLPDCNVTAASAGSSSLRSGAGTCRVEVPAQAFPTAGVSVQAFLRLNLYNGPIFLFSSAPEQLKLQSAAAASPSAPPTGAVLLMALPIRPIHPGETFRATLSAFVGSQQTITGFAVRLLFNASWMTYVKAEKSSLWAELDASLAPDNGGMALGLNAMRRTAADSMYQNRLVPLLDAYFELIDSAGPDGAVFVALDIRNGTSNGDVILLSAANPFVPEIIFQDFHAISVATSGSVTVATQRQLGLLAYMTNHDLFNSAVLDSEDVITPIQAFVVLDWSPSGAVDNTLVLPNNTSCSCSAPANVSNTLTITSCRVVLTSAHNQPVKQARLSVACGNMVALTAQVVVSVWYPGSYRVEASDPDSTLSSLLPINVQASATGTCMDRYQSTSLYLFTTWINGGLLNGDYITDVDVTRLVANWTTDAPQALRLARATATGLSAHPGVNVSALGARGNVLASIQLAISSEPVCVEALEAVALSSISVTSAMQPSSVGRWRVHFTPTQELNWEGASAKVSVFASFSDGTAMPVSSSSITTTYLPMTNSSAYSVLPFSLQPLPGYPALNLTVNASFGSPMVCGPFLKTTWSICSSPALAKTDGVLMATGSGTVRVDLPTPVRVELLQPSSTVITSANSGASQPPISVPTQSYLKVMVAFDDGVVRDMTTDRRVQVLVHEGADVCRVLRDDSTWQPYVEAVAGKSGSCELEARASFSGLPLLRNTITISVVMFVSMQVYVPEGTPAQPPTTNSSTLTNLVSQIDPIYLFKCDFSHYMPASVWVMGQLSSCGASCNLADLNFPSMTRLELTDTSAVNLTRNPSNMTLTNVLKPIKLGKSYLRVSFGTAISNLFTVSVEDPFQAGSPRVFDITDTGFTIAANMSSGSYKVTYLVQLASESNSASPTATIVEQAGLAMTAGNCSQANPCMMTATVTGLIPATNYTVFLAVRFEVARQSKLIRTIFAISSVLTSDNVPPSFTALGDMQNVTQDSTHFRMRVRVAMSEGGTISYVIYRNSSCVTGVERLPVQIVRSGGQLPKTVCTCNNTSLCEPVDWGNITMSDDQPSDVVTISGLLPPNPYDVLSTSILDNTCSTDALPPPATPAHMLYLVAQDDLPTYKGWNVTCGPPSSSPGDTCATIALAPCTSSPPVGSAASGANVQSAPYKLMQLGEELQGNMAGSPLLASFSLPPGDNIAFDPLVTTVTVASRTITFQFKVNRVAAIQYRLDQFSGAKAFSGIYPVYDPAMTYNVTISKGCNGTLLKEPSYTLWYWATDVYGQSSRPLSSSVIFG